MHDEIYPAPYGLPNAMELLSSRPAPQYFVRKCSRPYQPAFARQAERLTLFGATRAVLEDWFAVDALTIERWALEHPEFSNALKVKPIG